MNDYILPDGITENKAIIKIIGVGGGGCNAATRLYGEGLENVEFMVCNTDKAALDLSPIPEKIVLGTNLTRGGSDPGWRSRNGSQGGTGGRSRVHR